MTRDEMHTLTYILQDEPITLMDTMFIKALSILFIIMMATLLIGGIDFLFDSFFIKIPLYFLTVGITYVIIKKINNFLTKQENEEKERLVNKFYKEYKIEDRKDFKENFVKTYKFYQAEHIFSEKNNENFRYIMKNYKNYKKVNHKYEDYGPRDGGSNILREKIKNEIERMKREKEDSI